MSFCGGELLLAGDKLDNGKGGNERDGRRDHLHSAERRENARASTPQALASCLAQEAHCPIYLAVTALENGSFQRELWGPAFFARVGAA